MNSTNLQAVILDAIIAIDLIAIGLWFMGECRRWLFMVLSFCFFGLSASLTILILGDVGILMNHDADDFWFMGRNWRALPWRYGFAFGFTIIAGVLRFGRFGNNIKR